MVANIPWAIHGKIEWATSHSSSGFPKGDYLPVSFCPDRASGPGHLEICQLPTLLISKVQRAEENCPAI